MKRLLSLRTLLVLLLLAATGVLSAKPDSDTPVPFTGKSHFGRRYDPNLKPDRPARVFRAAPLVYPEKWRAWGQPAYAVVEFLVADTGFPKEVQCIEATDRAFAKEAIKTIENSYFDPAFKNQQGVYSKLTLRLDFSVKPQGSGQPAESNAAATAPAQ